MQFDITKVNEVYADYNIQLAEAKKTNEQTVFQYETPAGNKAARSHIYKLRQSKSSIEKARKNAKQESLEYGRMIDAEGKRLISEIEIMIEVHEMPLKEIAGREKERIDAIQAMIDDIKYAGIDKELNQYHNLCSAGMKEVYEKIFNTVIGDEFAEFKTIAFEAKDGTLKRLLDKVAELSKAEDEAFELSRLRIESEQRAQKEHDERIAREAKAEEERKAHEEKVRAEFEAKAEKERIEREKKDAIEHAEREKQQAIENADRAKREQIAQEERAKIEREQAIHREKIAVEQARQAEIDRQNAEKQQIAAEQSKKEANKRHVGRIRKEAKESIMRFGFNEDDARRFVLAINDGKIKNVTINY